MTSKIRFVGFDTQQQQKLNDFHQKNIAGKLINYEVKSSRHGEEYEVMFKSGTQSPKKMEVPTLMVEMATAPKTITLDTLADMEVWQKVTVNIKVVEVREEFQVNDKIKQDVNIADQTGVAKICLWEERVSCIKEHKSYCLKNLVVREFQSTKYFSMLKEGTDISLIDVIGTVAQQTNSEEELLVIENVTIIEVHTWTSTKPVYSAKYK